MGADGGIGPRGRGAVRRDRRPAVGWLWRWFAFVVVALRYPILLAWIAAAVAATLYLPGMAASGAIGDLVPKGSPGLQAEYDATRLFGLPPTSQVDIVQPDPPRFPQQAHAPAVAPASALS